MYFPFALLMHIMFDKKVKYKLKIFNSFLTFSLSEFHPRNAFTLSPLVKRRFIELLLDHFYITKWKLALELGLNNFDIDLLLD